MHNGWNLRKRKRKTCVESFEKVGLVSQQDVGRVAIQRKRLSWSGVGTESIDKNGPSGRFPVGLSGRSKNSSNYRTEMAAEPFRLCTDVEVQRRRRSRPWETASTASMRWVGSCDLPERSNHVERIVSDWQRRAHCTRTSTSHASASSATCV